MKDFKPSTMAICFILARGDRAAGSLLDRIHHWSKSGKIEIPGAEGVWLANTREWWMREAVLSLKQYKVAAARLVDLGLIEKRQYPFKGRDVLHVRPTILTNDILDAATTWATAIEVFELSGVPIPEVVVKPTPKISPSLHEMAEGVRQHRTAQEVRHLAEFRHHMHSNDGYGGWTLEVLNWVVQHWAIFLEGVCGWVEDHQRLPR